MQKNTQYQQATPLDCHTGFLSVSPAAACQGESLKPLEKFTIWRNRRHEENDFICCRNICRKCGRCNCNVHFTGEQKISEGERKMASIDLTIRNKKKEAKRYEAYLKKLGKKKVEQKKGEQKK